MSATGIQAAGLMSHVLAPQSQPGHRRCRPLQVFFLLCIVCATTGCAGLTAREKGALIGGAGGAAGGALLGAATGSAVIGAAIGGPVGLVGGYLLGDHFFSDSSSRQRSTSQGRPYTSRANAQSRSRARASVTPVQSTPPPRGEEETGRVF